MAGENVIELLVKAGILDDRQHDTVHSRAKSSNGGQLVQEVAELGYATESTVARALSVELGLPRIDLHVTPPEPDATLLLQLKFCIDRFVLPVALREGGELLWLAMGDPTDSTTMALVRRQTGKRVRPVVAGPTEILREARRIYGDTGESEDSEQQFEEDSNAIAINESDSEEVFEVLNIADEGATPTETPAAFPLPPPPPIDDGSDEGDVATAPVAAGEASANRPISDRSRGPKTPKPTSKPNLSRPPPARPAAHPPLDLNEWLKTTKTEAGMENDLHAEDVLSLEAVRASMEKAALVLRALAELCVEKGLFTREEMRNKSR